MCSHRTIFSLLFIFPLNSTQKGTWSKRYHNSLNHYQFVLYCIVNSEQWTSAPTHTHTRFHFSEAPELILKMEQFAWVTMEREMEKVTKAKKNAEFSNWIVWCSRMCFIHLDVSIIVWTGLRHHHRHHLMVQITHAHICRSGNLIKVFTFHCHSGHCWRCARRLCTFCTWSETFHPHIVLQT